MAPWLQDLASRLIRLKVFSLDKNYFTRKDKKITFVNDHVLLQRRVGHELLRADFAHNLFLDLF